MSPLLRRIAPAELSLALRSESRALDAATIEAAGRIVVDVRLGGEAALREHAERLGDVAPGAALVRDVGELARALAEIPREDRELLLRTAARIRVFAEAQRASLAPFDLAIQGGRAGQVIVPLASAGCYGPGGRHPLPSSVLMTAITARVAGVQSVWVASPRPAPITLAAAAVAGVEGFLACGGAQAIAALAYGAGAVPPCEAVVGPGNRFVIAAKKLVAGDVAIDMLAGPSELLVLADRNADPALVAADLLAQAEHDEDARPLLVTTDPGLVGAVEGELERQLTDLPTAKTARAALERNGFALVVGSLDEACAASEQIAPEHLELMVEDPRSLSPRLSRYGALFLGQGSAEVLGDYGAGPNHVLPTGGTARIASGLSVLTFLRVRTWLETGVASAQGLARDAAHFARLEGLEAHARAADRRVDGR